MLNLYPRWLNQLNIYMALFFCDEIIIPSHMPKRLNIKDMLAAGVIEPGPVIVKYCKLELRGILHKNGVFSQSINIRATASRKKKVCMLPAFATASGFGLHMLRTVNPAVQAVNGYARIYYKGEKLGVIRDRLQAKNDAKSNSVINHLRLRIQHHVLPFAAWFWCFNFWIDRSGGDCINNTLTCSIILCL